MPTCHVMYCGEFNNLTERYVTFTDERTGYRVGALVFYCEKHDILTHKITPK